MTPRSNLEVANCDLKIDHSRAASWKLTVRETTPVSLDLLVHSLRRLPVETGEIFIQQHVLVSNAKDGRIRGSTPDAGSSASPSTEDRARASTRGA
jgi:hypothetical protein